jgi:hypothetical protein
VAKFLPVLRISILIVLFGVLAILPWALTLLSPPLPYDFRITGTALAATRTQRLYAPTWIAQTETARPTRTQTLPPTHTLAPSGTPTFTPTLSPTPTETPTPTRTPLPLVLGAAAVDVNVYTCPGDADPIGALVAGQTFTVLGWDEVEIDNGLSSWVMFEDPGVGAQFWVLVDENIAISEPNYKEFLPRIACVR